MVLLGRSDAVVGDPYPFALGKRCRNEGCPAECHAFAVHSGLNRVGIVVESQAAAVGGASHPGPEPYLLGPRAPIEPGQGTPYPMQSAVFSRCRLPLT
jgi:hypothetical protein